MMELNCFIYLVSFMGSKHLTQDFILITVNNEISWYLTLISLFVASPTYLTGIQNVKFTTLQDLSLL